MGRYKGLPLSPGGVSASSISNREARMDATAILMAKMIHATTGNMDPLHDAMASILADPERMGSACLTMVNLIWAQATNSDRNVQGGIDLCNYLTQSLLKEHA